LSSFEVYALAIGANLCYSSASMVFTHYAKRFSSLWINQVKVITAFIAFIVAMVFSEQIISLSPGVQGLLVLSGFTGMCLGDVLIYKAYTTLGPARTLVLYSFQPLLLGIYGFIFLNQIFSINQTFAVICMLFCIFIFMLERNKLTGQWDLQSFLWAFSGVTFDAIGVMITRTAYELNPDLQTFQVNTIRCIGALVGFFLISPKSYLTLPKDVWSLRKREISLVLGAGFCGCFLSLALYLAAVKHAHVGTLTAISITGPIWVSLLECLYYKRLPNKYLVGAFGFFLIGFFLML